MVDNSTVSCTDLKNGGIPTPCSFDASKQILSLPSLVGAQGLPSGSSIKFTVYPVLNPISTDVIATLTVLTADSLGGIIDEG